MPTFHYQTYNDIPEWIICPLCSEYSTHHKSYFLKHLNSCKEYEGHIDDILNFNIDENTTIEEYINRELNCITSTKQLIKSNEIELNRNEDYQIIIKIIKNKLLENIKEYSGINLDAIKIYQLFFGCTEESEENYIDEFGKWAGW
jgi:hypothetical protein